MKKIAKFFIRIYDSYILEEQFKRHLDLSEYRIKFLEEVLVSIYNGEKRYIILAESLSKKLSEKKEFENL